MVDVPIISLDEDGVAFITELKPSPQFGWYLQRRVRALARVGMLAAGVDWNPIEHPRGPDGKFIRKFGLVRWLKDGVWERGTVLSIDSVNGDVTVQPLEGHSAKFGPNFGPDTQVFSHHDAEKRLYAEPKAKAKIVLPDPKSNASGPGWKKTGGQLGSNAGGMYEVTSPVTTADLPSSDAEIPGVGDKYYIKTAKSTDHARQEALANDLYELGGVYVPSVTTSVGDTQIASKVAVPIATKEKTLNPNGDPAVLSKVRANLVFDAWLANWDVIGQDYDNVQVVDGEPLRVDTGGALMYRAQGQPKAGMFGPTVTELDSLRNAEINYQAASVFGATTPDELKSGGERLRAISPADIRQAVEDRNLPDTLADTLIARRTSVLAQIGMDDALDKPKATLAEPEITTENVQTALDSLVNDFTPEEIASIKQSYADDPPEGLIDALNTFEETGVLPPPPKATTTLPEYVIDEPPVAAEQINKVFEGIGNAGLDEVSPTEMHWDTWTHTWEPGAGPSFDARVGAYNQSTGELDDQGLLQVGTLAGDKVSSGPWIIRTERGYQLATIEKVNDGAFTVLYQDAAIGAYRIESSVPPNTELHVFMPPKDDLSGWWYGYRNAYKGALEPATTENVKAHGTEMPTLHMTSGDPLRPDEYAALAFSARVHPWDGTDQDLRARNRSDGAYGWIIQDFGGVETPLRVMGLAQHDGSTDITAEDMDGVSITLLAQDTGSGILVSSNPVLDEIFDARKELADGVAMIDDITNSGPSKPLDQPDVHLPEIEQMGVEAVGEDLAKWLSNMEPGGAVHSDEDVELQGNIIINAGYGKEDILKYLAEYDATDISADTWIWKETQHTGWEGKPLPAVGDTVYQDGMYPYTVTNIGLNPGEDPIPVASNADMGESVESPDLKTFMTFFKPEKEAPVSDAMTWAEYTGGLPEVDDAVIYNGQNMNVVDVIGGTVKISDGAHVIAFDNPKDYYDQVTQPPEPEDIEEDVILPEDVPPGGKFNIISSPKRVSNDTDPATLQHLVGKNIFLKKISGHGTSTQGFFTLLEVRKQQYNEDHVRNLRLKSAQGLIYTWTPSGGKEASIAETEYAPPYIKNLTLKQNGTININGYVVGTWTKDSGVYKGVITPEYSPTGEYITVSTVKKAALKKFLAPQVLTPGAFDTHDAKPKTPATVAVKQATLNVTFSGTSATLADNAMDVKTLADGSDAKVGMWVTSSRDGSVGQITEIVGIHHFKEGGFEKAYGYVKVEYPGGKTGVRSSNTLYASPDPNTWAVPPVAPKWEAVKLGDDTQPYPAQPVLYNGAPTVILDIKMHKGTGKIKVRDPAQGKNVWVKADTITADPKNPIGKETEDLSPAGIIAILESEGLKEPNKLAKAGPVGYPGPDGAVISQPKSLYTKWFEGAPDRKLTKDGYVPTIGLWVRDNNGYSYRITKVAEAWKANPNSVRVWDPTTDHQVTRTASALSVDHERELATKIPAVISNIKIVKTVNSGSGTATMPVDALAVYVVGGKYTTPTYLVTTEKGDVWYLTQWGKWGRDKDYFSTLYNQWGSPPEIEKVATINPEDDGQVELVLIGKGTYGSKFVPIVSKKGENTLTLAEAANDELNAPKPEPVPTPTPHAPTSAPSSEGNLVNPETGQPILPPLSTSEVPTPATPEVPGAPGVETSPPVPTTQVTVGIPPKYSGSLSNLPKPADVMEAPTDPNVYSGYPEVPIPAGEGFRLGGNSAVPAGVTVEKAYTNVLTGWKNQEFKPGSGVQYSMTDSDKIEDLTVRTQIVKDITGEHYVEVRFGLLEGAVDDLADRLLTTNSNVTSQPVGGWDESEKIYVTDLVPGDNMTAKVSEFEDLAGTLKPITDASAPNVTVTDFPLLVGKAEGGYDVYSVPVVNVSGVPGVIYIQKRENPSITKFDWNPDKPLATNQSIPAQVSPRAAQLGWEVSSTGIGTPKVHGDPSWTGLEVDTATGVKDVYIDGPNVHQILTTDPRSKRLILKNSAGSSVNVQVTHTDSSRTQSVLSGHNGRRATPNGEVLIRVPVDHPDPMAQVSEMMAAVGIAPQEQGQPTNAQIRALAMNKVYKQLSPSYDHMKLPKQGDEAAVLKLIDNLVGPQLGRPATIDDIRLRINPQGAPSIVFSDDVAHAMAVKTGTKTLYHAFEEDENIEKKLKVMVASRVSQGILSGDERWSAGIFLNGTYGNGSPKKDARNDAGNRIYFHRSNSSSIQLQAGRIYSPSEVLFKQTDWYWTSDDAYGQRSSSPGANLAFYTNTHTGQTMLKRMFEGDLWGRVVVPHGRRQSIIEALKKDGVFYLGGRPIEDVITEPHTGSPEDFDVPLVPPDSVEVPISTAGLDAGAPV